MKGLFLHLLGIVLVIAVVMAGFLGYYALTMPEYRDELGNGTYEEKIKGLYLLKASADRENNLIIYGSSELLTLDIPTNPANFFAGKRSGFQVNLVGRGSCQSIIHALSIASSGDSLNGKKVVLITSPQSYVKDGIASDLFMANYSELQYLELMLDPSIGPDIKRQFSERVAEMIGRYENERGELKGFDASRRLSRYGAREDGFSRVMLAVMSPYFEIVRYLARLSDMKNSKALLKTAEVSPEKSSGAIDWEAEEKTVIEVARGAAKNNDYGILDGYYNTYIGSRLARQKDKDRNLSYSESVEYDDLRLLLEVCKLKGIEVMFLHVPLHGEWSDYVGFTGERREDYYQNVLKIVSEYPVKLVDLTNNEYEEYFLCDIMHLGWKGWLAADEKIDEFYHQN